MKKKNLILLVCICTILHKMNVGLFLIVVCICKNQPILTFKAQSDSFFSHEHVTLGIFKYLIVKKCSIVCIVCFYTDNH